MATAAAAAAAIEPHPSGGPTEEYEREPVWFAATPLWMDRPGR